MRTTGTPTSTSEKLGFRQVGITRASERGDDGTWHDELLMEYVVEPAPRREPPGGQRSATAR